MKSNEFVGLSPSLLHKGCWQEVALGQQRGLLLPSTYSGKLLQINGSFYLLPVVTRAFTVIAFVRLLDEAQHSCLLGTPLEW